MGDQILIEKIVSNPVLQDAVSKMVDRTKALNLVDTDWENILKSNELYQMYQQGKIRYSKGHSAKGEAIYVRNVIGMQNQFNVIVAGYWSFGIPEENSLEMKPKGVSIVTRLCGPLNEIGKVMVENQQQKLHDNCKFFIETCDPLFCISCKRSMLHLAKLNNSSAMFPNNWCINKTKLFNGENIKHHYRQTVEDSFGTSTFCGILRLTITSRYTFGDEALKIAGICREMILFGESALDPIEEIDIEYPSIENLKSYPTITFPSDKELVIEGIPEQDITDEPKVKKRKL